MAKSNFTFRKKKTDEIDKNAIELAKINLQWVCEHFKTK